MKQDKAIRRITGCFLASLAIAAQTLPAWAAAPMVKTQAPGYYRMMLGGFEVTALSDGTVDLPVDKLLNQAPEKTVEALRASMLTPPVESSNNSYLINTGPKLILIDTGAGTLLGPTLGKLVGNLRASGYTPEQVDEVYVTHMHPDHVGGLVGEGGRAFPNAVVRANRRDADYWLSEAQMALAPREIRRRFTGAMGAIKPYMTAGRFLPFEDNAELLPGIHAIAGHGHTPGHTLFLVESQGQKLALLGDAVIVAGVQLAHPEVTMSFDSDPAAVVTRRAEVLEDATRQGYWAGLAHFSFPGLGHFRRDDSGYRFIPAGYTRLR